MWFWSSYYEMWRLMTETDKTNSIKSKLHLFLVIVKYNQVIYYYDLGLFKVKLTGQYIIIYQCLMI